MMQIKCEMCGSSDMVKEDSLYVCKHCGMKYSPEEAKKMMVEIEGAVKIDDSEELANLYVLARRAKDNEDLAGALKYYNDILAKDPMNWEAVFFSLILDHTEQAVAVVDQSCIKIFNGLPSVINLVSETVKDDEERKKAYDDMAKYTAWATRNIFSVVQQEQGYFEERRSKILRYLHNIVYSFAKEVRRIFPNGEYIDAVMLCIKQGVEIQSIKINEYPSYNNFGERKNYFRWVEDIKQYDPSYAIPEIPALTAEQIAKENSQKAAEEAAKAKQEAAEKAAKEKNHQLSDAFAALAFLILAILFAKWVFGLIFGGLFGF